MASANGASTPPETLHSTTNTSAGKRKRDSDGASALEGVAAAPQGVTPRKAQAQQDILEVLKTYATPRSMPKHFLPGF